MHRRDTSVARDPRTVRRVGRDVRIANGSTYLPRRRAVNGPRWERGARATDELVSEDQPGTSASTAHPASHEDGLTPDDQNRLAIALIVSLLCHALLFTIGKSLLGIYLGKASFDSSYGAAGSLVVLLVWVYYSAQILFLGAEFTQVQARHRGRILEPTEKATTLAEAS